MGKPSIHTSIVTQSFDTCTDLTTQFTLTLIHQRRKSFRNILTEVKFHFEQNKKTEYREEINKERHASVNLVDLAFLHVVLFSIFKHQI